MTPTLSEITATPEILRDFFIQHNLSETYVETKSMTDIKYPLENTEEFVWSHIKTFMSLRGGYYNFKFNNLDMFYNIIFPDYSNSEIVQLLSALTFIDKLFNHENEEVPNNSCSVTVIKPTISVDNSYFTIMQKSANSFLFQTKHTEFHVTDISFNTLYSAILIDLKEHIENYVGRDLAVIDTTIFKSMLDESSQSYMNRLFNNSVVKPITKKEFKESLKDVKSIIINEYIKVDDYDTAFLVNKETFKEIDSDDNKQGVGFYISLKNMLILKKVLNKSMASKDIDLLINNIAMTAFYHNLTMPHEPINCIYFSRHEIDHLNKTDIARKDYFYSISIGRDTFTLGMELGINIVHAPRCIKTVSMEELYQKQFQKITSKICDILATDCDNVTVADLQVIDMAIF